MRYGQEVTPKKRGAEVEGIRITALTRHALAAKTLVNPAPGFSKPQQPDGRKRRLIDGEEQLLLSVLDHHPVRATKTLGM
ncbi:MAG: hypothetical protein ACO265_07410 [Polynucleobacter sp.]